MTTTDQYEETRTCGRMTMKGGVVYGPDGEFVAQLCGRGDITIMSDRLWPQDLRDIADLAEGSNESAPEAP